MYHRLHYKLLNYKLHYKIPEIPINKRFKRFPVFFIPLNRVHYIKVWKSHNVITLFFWYAISLKKIAFYFDTPPKFGFFDLTDKDPSCDKTVKEYMCIDQITITSYFRNGTSIRPF